MDKRIGIGIGVAAIVSLAFWAGRTTSGSASGPSRVPSSTQQSKARAPVSLVASAEASTESSEPTPNPPERGARVRAALSDLRASGPADSTDAAAAIVQALDLATAKLVNDQVRVASRECYKNGCAVTFSVDDRVDSRAFQHDAGRLTKSLHDGPLIISSALPSDDGGTSIVMILLSDLTPTRP